MKRVGIYGSCGSIGRQALDFISANEGEFCAHALVTRSDAELLSAQAEKFSPSIVGISDERAVSRLHGCKAEVLTGKEAEAACDDCDVILFCAVGAEVLPALIRYIRKGKTIALANKECLVAAGELVMREAKKFGATILPVDSEHSAVWQCLRAGNRSDVEKIILTASGGRYYSYPIEELSKITPEQAINHPNWKMGRKISVDSATMVNKAFELIEARWLFGTEKVGYIIHPQSIIHCMVLFKDGALIAQLSEPDMRLPISVALSYPERRNGGIKNFEFDRPLTFLPKREDVFFAPKFAKYCIESGGSAGAVFDAADEVAVKLFLDGKIAFTDIAELVRDELYGAKIEKISSVGDVLEVRNEVKNNVMNKYSRVKH